MRTLLRRLAFGILGMAAVVGTTAGICDGGTPPPPIDPRTKCAINNSDGTWSGLVANGHLKFNVTSPPWCPVVIAQNASPSFGAEADINGDIVVPGSMLVDIRNGNNFTVATNSFFFTPVSGTNRWKTQALLSYPAGTGPGSPVDKAYSTLSLWNSPGVATGRVDLPWRAPANPTQARAPLGAVYVNDQLQFTADGNYSQQTAEYQFTVDGIPKGWNTSVGYTYQMPFGFHTSGNHVVQLQVKDFYGVIRNATNLNLNVQPRPSCGGKAC